MKTASYHFDATAVWVTDAACADLREKFGVNVEVARHRRDSCGGTLKIKGETEKSLADAQAFIKTHGVYSCHFKNSKK